MSPICLEEYVRPFGALFFFGMDCFDLWALSRLFFPMMLISFLSQGISPLELELCKNYAWNIVISPILLACHWEWTLPGASCRVSCRLVILADQVEFNWIRIHPALQAAGNSNLNGKKVLHFLEGWHKPAGRYGSNILVSRGWYSGKPEGTAFMGK